MLLCLDNLKNPVIISHDAGEINRDYRFGSFCDSIGNPVIIHLKRAGDAVNHHRMRTNVAHDAGGRCIRICRDNHLIALSDAEHAKRQFHSRRS